MDKPNIIHKAEEAEKVTSTHSKKELKELEEICKDLEAVDEKLLSKIRAEVEGMEEKTRNRSSLDSCIKSGLAALLSKLKLQDISRSTLKKTRGKVTDAQTRHTLLVTLVIPEQPKTKNYEEIQYIRKLLEQDKKSCFCQFIVSFIKILFTYLQ